MIARVEFSFLKEGRKLKALRISRQLICLPHVHHCIFFRKNLQRVTRYNVCAVHWGGGGGSVHRSSSGVLSTLESYHDAVWGAFLNIFRVAQYIGELSRCLLGCFPEYIRGCSVHWRAIMMPYGVLS